MRTVTWLLQTIGIRAPECETLSDNCLFQLHSASFSQGKLVAHKISAFTIQTSDFPYNMSFCRVMADITLLDDKEPEAEEGVDEQVRYVLLHLL